VWEREGWLLTSNFDFLSIAKFQLMIKEMLNIQVNSTKSELRNRSVDQAEILDTLLFSKSFRPNGGLRCTLRPFWNYVSKIHLYMDGFGSGPMPYFKHCIRTPKIHQNGLFLLSKINWNEQFDIVEYKFKLY
jgi:hypothetical protein